MKLFAPWYERALRWSMHPKAPALLAFWSFIEAIFFPIPPEVMLAPMSLARPRRALWFATISLAGSTVGMIIGYAIGFYAIDLAQPLMERLGWWEKFLEVKEVAIEHGFWLLLIGGFTPIPFKLLTLASGAVGMPLLPFFAGALIGRAKRVYVVAGLIRWGGERAEAFVHKWIEPIGWIALALLVALVVAIKFWH